jgi:thiamine pyrophosphokinase
MTKQNGVCYIVCAGQNFGLNFKPATGDFVIAVDAGFNYLMEAGIKADLIVGDFDSLKDTPNHPNIIKLNSEKNDTDTHYALEHAFDLGYKKFCIYCGTGGRLSHTLANFQSMLSLTKRGCDVQMFGQNEVYTTLSNNTLYFNEFQQGYISVFSMSSRSEGVTLCGLKYPLTDYLMLNSYPIGVSNQFVGNTASVTVRNGDLLVIYSEN